MSEQARSPWELGGLSVRELGRRVMKETSDDEVTDRAASLAYYFLFALFPALLFLTSLLSFLPLPTLMDRLMGYLAQVMPGEAGGVIKDSLAEALQGGRGGLLSVGAVLALWSASAAMASIMTALNVVYDLEEARPWWKRRLVALALTLVFSLFVVGGLALMAFGPQIGRAVADPLGFGTAFETLWSILSVPVALVLVTIAVAFLYYMAPAAEQRWQWVTPGSALAVVLWGLASIGLRFYVTHFGNYNATYGSIGAVILLMLWLYVTGLILMIGAEVNAEIEHAAAMRGAATAKPSGRAAAREPAPGRVAALVPRGGDRHASDPGVQGRWAAASAGGRREPSDPELGGVAVAAKLEDVFRQGRTSWLTLLVGAVLGWLFQRPGRQTPRLARRAATTGWLVLGAMGAWERFRHQRQERRKAA